MGDRMKDFVHAKKLRILCLLLLGGCIAFCCCFFFLSQNPETFHDMIVEFVAYTKTNKSVEINCFWFVTGVGVLLLVLDFLRDLYRKKKEEKEKVVTPFFAVVVTMITVLVGHYIFTMTTLPFVLLALCLLLLAHKCIPGKEAHTLVAFCFLFYAFYGVFVFINHFVEVAVQKELLFIASFLVTLWCVCKEEKKDILRKLILVAQIPISLPFLNFLVDKYLYQGKMMTLPQPFFAALVFWSILLGVMVFNLVHLFRTWKKKDATLDQLIALPSILTIFMLNSIQGTIYGTANLITIPDYHHPGENIQAFHQIFLKGQTPYQTYIPVSGLFSVVIGFLLELCGGVMTHYKSALVLFELFFSLITIWLVSRHLSKTESLLFSMLVLLVSYNRISLIMAILLILLFPRLIANKNCWLKVWLWLCFLGGLYYPLYGAAVLLGTLPFGIGQFIGYLKSTDFKKQRKQVSFYVWWGVTLLPIVLCIPLLIRMLKHTMTYSGQSLLADSISVFTQELPEGFLQILGPGKLLAQLCYWCLRYVIPAGAIWLFTLLLLGLFSSCKSKKDVWQKIQTPAFLLLPAGLFILAVSYTFTLMRADYQMLLSRTGNIITIVCGMIYLIIVFKNYQKSLFYPITFGVVLSILIQLGSSPLTMEKYQLVHHYNVPSDYTYVEEGDLPRIGTGFVSTKVSYLTSKDGEEYTIENMKQLHDTAQKLLQYDPDLSFVLYGPLALYYILDLKTVSQPSIAAIKSKKTSEEFIEVVKREKPVIGRYLADTLANYYIYHYLMTTDDYQYSSEYDVFLPTELYQKIDGQKEGEWKCASQIKTNDLGKAPASLGESYQTLKKNFKEVKMQYQVKTNRDEKTASYTYQFTTPIQKDEVDFLYLEVDTNRDFYNEKSLRNRLQIDLTNMDIPVTVSWGGEEKITALLSRGRLLIGLGVDCDWLLQSHSSLQIQIEGIEPQYQVAIKKMQFLKLKEAKGK